MTALLIQNIGQLVTLAPMTRLKASDRLEPTHCGILKHAWLLVEQGRIARVGEGSPPPDLQKSNIPIVDAEGGLVLPGLIDSHTHPIFAGSRAQEFCQRLAGKTYQEIASSGGGIASTVRATRAASDETLGQLVDARLKTFLGRGVTTVEVKTGYGLSVTEEIRHLRVLKAARSRTQQTLHVTSLAPHAIPEGAASAKAWCDEAARSVLPVIAAENLADSVDAFVERGWFLPEDTKAWFTRSKEVGLKIRMHADEFADSGAAAFAAEMGALSADHCQHASDEGIKAMATAGVVATLLPGTSLYSRIPWADARRFTRAGCRVALATDFNPGSCLIDNLGLIVTIGALHCGLTPTEALAAVTWHGAIALGLQEAKGALTPGRDADLVIFPFTSVDEFVADLGRTGPTHVVAMGNLCTPHTETQKSTT
jgi:imidazolonepropionase